MQSKISYFRGNGNQILNRGIWWKDIVSFWPLWTVEFLLLQVITSLPLTNQMNIVRQEYIASQKELEMHRLFHVAVSTGSYVVLIAVLAIVAAVFVFGYLNHSRSAYMLHSLPVSRGTYFITHFLSGLFMLFVPFAVTYVTLWGIGIRYHLGMSAVVFGNLFTTFLVILFFYSLACVVVMLSGNGIMSLVIYGVLNVLEIGVSALLGTVSELFLYAGSFDMQRGIFDNICTPILGFIMLFKEKAQYGIVISSRLLPGMMGEGMRGYTFSSENAEMRQKILQSLASVDGKSIGFCLLSLVVSAVFLLVAYQLYRKRALESVGDMVAFRWCKPVFKAVFCVCGSLLCVCLLAVLFSGRLANVTYGNQRFVCVVFMIFGCIISYLTGDMILAKSFSIWKKLSWGQMGIFCGAMIIVLGVNYFACINRQLSTEMAEKAEYISLGIDGTSFLYSKEEYERLGLEQIRQKIVREGQNLTPAESGRAYTEYNTELFINYEYILSGEGNDVSCSYYINEKKQEELLQSLKDAMNDTDNMAQALFTEAYESAKCKMMEIRKKSEDETLYRVKDSDTRDRVFQAFLKDLQEGKVSADSMGTYGHFKEEGTALHVQTKIPDAKLKQAGIDEGLWWNYGNREVTVDVTEEMENTWREVQSLKETDLKEEKEFFE